ncbi:MAG: sigma 54-interacting transcriptional regulator [Rhodopseudomonas palustris]|uniref:Sigma 54-interacting transcriptional regulator n=1 Tax=Rhodopseudomonas palustris TaxID=1076 RepID=A0A933S1E2_RHOPL|nr:sigma 54-interacting transcriptional regulator [Rhodopseudomonas palustris]
MCLLKQRDRAAADHDDHSDPIVGDSRAMRIAMEKLRRVAPTSLSVLLLGESGTGKGVLAREIHRLSPRREAPFVQVNSAALAESVLESELFGHEKGAFTGAASQRQGRFELADGGTLFLDEIGEISPSFQAKLLRVLQEREFERVGGTTTIRVDVRIIAATNCGLEAAVAAGRFRSDLYFRLNTVPIRLPPLRERRDDIPAFAARALEQFNRDSERQLTFSPSATAVMRGCSFPGNIRELENCVRRTAILARRPIIRASDFACRGEGCTTQQMIRSAALHAATSSARRPAGAGREPLSQSADSEPRNRPALGRKPGRHRVVDADRLVDALRKVGWSQAKAGRLLGVTSRQVRYALKRHGIKIQKT